MFRPVLSTLILATLASPAAAFRAQNGMTVTPAGAGAFLVHFPSPASETEYLCAAGDYVIRALGKDSDTRIWRESPAPRRQGQGITFTLDPAKKTDMALYTSFGATKGDGGISAGTARDSYCAILRIFPEF